MPPPPGAGAARGGAGGRNLLLVRTGITFALFASVFSVQLQEPELLLSEEFRFLYLALVLSYGGLLFRYALLGSGELTMRSALPQALADVGFASLIVYATGLPDSFFTFMYVVVILLGSLELSMKGGVLWAVLSSLAYLVLLHLHSRGIIVPPGYDGFPPAPSEVVRPAVAGAVAFLLTGTLSGLLGQDVRRVRLQVEKREDDLRNLELFSRCVIENISSGIVAAGTDGRVSMANGSACAILGMAAARLDGMSLSALFPGMGLPGEAGGRLRPEVLHHREDGTEVPLGCSASPLRDTGGEVVGTVVVFQDLTPIRTMEERVRMSDRLAALGELAAGFAHEVRNPLASIAGSSQMLQEVPRLPEETRPLVEIIGRESRRLDALITDFLAFSTPIRPAGPGAVDLSTLAADVAEAIRAGEGREKGVPVEYSGEEGVRVRGSREELSQVVWNLARNAVQAGGEGNAVTLAVSRQVRLGESFGAVTVTDRGRGIDPSVRGRIFNPFFTTKEGGTGLGLAICQRIVHGHQGFIEVRSLPGEGASFTVLVPLSTGEDDGPGESS